MNGIERIDGYSKALTHFGRWPSFHDAEVVRVELDRGEESSPVLRASVHAFNLTSKIDPKGHYVTENHGIIHFEFIDVCELSLTGFNHQNALAGLSITDISERQLERQKFEVSFDGEFGLECSFLCGVARILSITPGIPDNSVYARYP